MLGTPAAVSQRGLLWADPPDDEERRTVWRQDRVLAAGGVLATPRVRCRRDAVLAVDHLAIVRDGNRIRQQVCPLATEHRLGVALDAIRADIAVVLAVCEDAKRPG